MAYTDQADERARAPSEQEEEYEGQDLEKYLAMWREYADTYSEPRKASRRDRVYYDGDVTGTGLGHWSQTELESLKDRRQPPSVFNVIKRKVDATVGVELRARSEPRGWPRTPKDQKSAEVATDSLRFVKEKTRWLSKKTNGMEKLSVEGIEAYIVDGAPDDVPVTLIDPQEFWFDPRSRWYDFHDARYMGTAKWMDLDMAKAMYLPPEPEPLPEFPDEYLGDENALAQYAEMQRAHKAATAKRDMIEGYLNATCDGGMGDDFDDLPKTNFGDSKRKRVFIMDVWHQDPKKGWFRCVFTGKGKLFTEQAYLVDEDDTRAIPMDQKRKRHPIYATSAYVSVDLWRYGIVRDMIPIQDEINKRRSKALHLLTTATVIAPNATSAQNGGADSLRQEANRPDGYIIGNANEVRIERNIALAQGQQALHEDAVQFIEQYGPNPQLQGMRDGAGSGRAILALQQAGLGQMAPLFERHRELELRVYKAMWSRVQQSWTAPMYVRVTDDENNARFAAVNGARVYDQQGQPVVKGQGAGGGLAQPQASNVIPMRPGMSPQAPQSPMQMGAPSPMMGHNGGPPMEPEYETGPLLAELDVDIIIDAAPEAAVLQAEQFNEFSKLLAAVPGAIPPDLAAELLLKLSMMPNKSEALDLIKKHKESMAKQGPPPPVQAEMAKTKAEIDNKNASTEKLKAETAQIVGADIPNTQADTDQKRATTLRTQVGARTDVINAETNARSGAAKARAADASTTLTQRETMLGAGLPSDGFPAAGDTGAPLLGEETGLPPLTGNGPPPF